MRRTWQAILLAMLSYQGTVSLHAESPRDSLVGKWKHESGVISLTFEETRLHFTCEGEWEQAENVFSLHADYSCTRDQTVFAMVTRVEVADESVRDQYGLVLLDEPICFRVRIEDGVLVIHDMKNIKNDITRKSLEGVYKPAVAVAADKPAGKKEEARHRPPKVATPVPSCALHGNHLDNFALRDHEGNVWEYKRDRHGRLILLEFWIHDGKPGLSAIPHLRQLQEDYGPNGLEVVSIECETGSIEEQRRHVQAVRFGYGIKYRTLLSNCGPERCPVMEQFHVEYFPLLVLIDSDGKILWRSTRDGMDDYEHFKLRKMISDTLIRRGR